MTIKLTGPKAITFLITAVAFSFAFFHLYTAGFGLAPDMVQRAVHVNFGVVLALLMTMERVKSGWTVAPIVALIVLSCASTLWLGFNYERLLLDPYWTTTTDFFMGVSIIVAIVISAYLLLGMPFVVLSLAAIGYALFGYMIPGAFNIPEFELEHIVQTLYATTRGLWGITTAATASTVAIFIVFGGMFLHTDGAKCFLQIASRMVGKTIGGPAKVATIFSALFGTVSGSAAANTSVTGNYTIPMMKKAGYTPEHAAGVESAASAGGQIAPPIMGAAAFVMAEFLGVSYSTIIIAAIIPATLYFFGMMVAADIHGRVHGLRSAEEESNTTKIDFRALAQFIVPIATFLFGFKIGLSETYAGFWGVVALTVVYLFTGYGALGDRCQNLLKGVIQGGRSLMLIAVLAGAAQIVVGMIGLTGVGLSITQLVSNMSEGAPVLALLLVGGVIIVMSMGMPTTAAYVLGISVGAPVLLGSGLTPLAAHMFVFYFASAAALTPPVCAGVFVAAGIAQADWLRSAFVAMWFGVAKYVVPLVFAFSGAILLQDVDFRGAITIISTFAGIGALSAGLALVGAKVSWKARVFSCLLVLSSILLIYPAIQAAIAGACLLVAALLWAKLSNLSLLAKGVQDSSFPVYRNCAK